MHARDEREATLVTGPTVHGARDLNRSLLRGSTPLCAMQLQLLVIILGRKGKTAQKKRRYGRPEPDGFSCICRRPYGRHHHRTSAPHRGAARRHLADPTRPGKAKGMRSGRTDEKLSEPGGLCARYGSAAARSDDTDTAGQLHRTNSEPATDPNLATTIIITRHRASTPRPRDVSTPPHHSRPSRLAGPVH